MFYFSVNTFLYRDFPKKSENIDQIWLPRITDRFLQPKCIRTKLRMFLNISSGVFGVPGTLFSLRG